MVFEVSPNYYASSAEEHGYVLRGLNFNQIPSDAIGILSTENDEPLRHINTVINPFMYRIIDKGETTMRLEQSEAEAIGAPTYLACIVSSDRQTVYWVNQTRPLP